MSSIPHHYHILIVHNQYKIAGGEDTVARNEEALLKKYGHNVVVYTRNNKELETYGFLQKLLLPFGTLFSLQSYREIKKLIRQHKIQIVHVHNTLPLISYSAYYAAKKSGCALIQTLHNYRLLCPNATFYRDHNICEECVSGSLLCGVKHACYRNSKAQTLLAVLMLKLHRLLGSFRLPDHYIALTEFQKRKFASLLPASNIKVKPNFSTCLRPSVPKKRDTFVYLARLDESKGIFVLLEAFRKLPGIPLLLMGTGPEEDSVKEIISSPDMGHITLAGLTPHELALDALYHAKALIFPTLWYEGFPMTIAESFSLGTPVIGSNIGNTASIIEHGKTGLLFEPGCSDALAEAVKNFLSDSCSFRTMERACLREYQNKYTPVKNYETLMDIYKASLDDVSVKQPISKS